MHKDVMSLENEVGKVYGEWVVLKNAGIVRKTVSVTHLLLCRCSCGKKTVVNYQNLRTGRTRSCGHKRIEAISKPVIYNGKEMSRLEFAALTKFSYTTVCQFLNSGETPEQILKRKWHVNEKRKMVSDIIKNTNVIGAFRTTKELSRAVGMTPQGIYARYRRGWELEEQDGEIVWIKGKNYRKKKKN